MDSLTFVRDLGADVRRPTSAELAAARARLMVEIEHETADRPVALASRRARREGDVVATAGALAPITPLEPHASRGRRLATIALAAAATIAVAAAAIGGVALLRELAPDDRIAAPTPTTPPTTDPTPSQTREPAPGDRSSWIIGEEGVGPFTIGMPWDDAVAAGTELGWDMSAAQGEGCTPWFGSPVGEGAMINVYGSEGAVFAIAISPAVDDGGALDETDAEVSPRTSGGVGPYDTIEDVRAAHPQVVPSEGMSGFETLDADGAGAAIHFGYRASEPSPPFQIGDLETIQINAFGAPLVELEGCMRGASGGEGEQPGATGSPPDWSITPTGIGPIRLGASLAETAALFGTAPHERSEGDASGCLSFDATTPQEGSIGASGHDGRIETIWVFAPGDNHDTRPDTATVPLTAEGIGPGVDVATVLDAWGPSNLRGAGGNIAWQQSGGDALIRAYSKDAVDDADVDNWINLMMVHDARVDGWCFD